MENINVPLVSGDEKDALTKNKNYFRWRAGVRKGIKQKYNKRNRKNAKKELRGNL